MALKNFLLMQKKMENQNFSEVKYCALPKAKVGLEFTKTLIGG
jgi:hypothetical protein